MWFRHVLKNVISVGKHGHTVEQIRTKLLHGLGKPDNMVIVDARNHNGIDFHMVTCRLHFILQETHQRTI